MKPPLNRGDLFFYVVCAIALIAEVLHWLAHHFKGNSQ